MITGETTLAELQQILEKSGLRMRLTSTRLNNKNEEAADGQLLFSVDDLAEPGSPFPSRIGVLSNDLAEAIDDAFDLEMRKQAGVG